MTNHPTQLQDAFAEFRLRFDLLATMSVINDHHFDEYAPDHLRALAENWKEFCFAADAFGYQMSIVSGFANTPEQRREHRFMVSDALFGNFDHELTERAERLEAEPVLEGGMS